MHRSSDIEDCEAPPFCIPADGVHIPRCRWDAGQGCCAAPECPALFTPAHLRARQRGWVAESPPKLIIAAGPERSGSTWLYNAVRLLFEHAQQPLDAFFIGDLSTSALDARWSWREGARHVLIKTHRWSSGWDPGRATHVFVTHRDLAQVVASYRRLGWASWLSGRYVDDHLRWQQLAELDLSFEEITQHPQACLQQLAQRLGLAGRVDCGAVQAELASLPVPERWMDPVTQIWPRHMSRRYLEARQATAAAGGGTAAGDAGPAAAARPLPSRSAAVSTSEAARLRQEHPAFYRLYPGYADAAAR